MLLTGLPMICEDVRDSIETVDAKDPLAFVIHYLMRGLIQAARSALTHYFPLTLQEHFLQDSRHGTPYQKWAFITNQDFAQVDRALRLLLNTSFAWRSRTRWITDTPDGATLTRMSLCFDHIKKHHVTCAVDSQQPTLILSGIQHLQWSSVIGWGDKGPIFEELPPTLLTCTVDISDRRRLSELQQDGLAELARMESHANGLAEWLQLHYRMDDILSPSVLPLDLDEPGFPRWRQTAP
jgi:hypothetical protein